jgi:hypothetical protein
MRRYRRNEIGSLHHENSRWSSGAALRSGFVKVLNLIA